MNDKNAINEMMKIDAHMTGSDQSHIEKLKWDLDKAHAELGKAIDTLRDIYHYGGAMRGKWAQEKTERTLAELGKDVQHDNETPS